MSHVLYRLARWSYRQRRFVVSFWVLLVVAAGAGAATLSGPTSDTFNLPGIESSRAFDLIKERSPGATPDGAQARIVFQAPEGETLSTAENRKLITDTLEAAKTENVASVVSPFDAGTISEDGRTAFATISYTEQSIALTDADRQALETAPDEAREAGLTVAIGGDALQEVTEMGSSELVGVAMALVVLVITFGSLSAAGMPLLTALFGVGIGVAGITIATGFMDLGSTTPILATMLGLAVGIDYALFIVSRHRHELLIGRSPEEAAGRAVGTAGSAVVVAGLTVIIALLGLGVVGISFLTQMGTAAAATVAVAVLVALTLLPALFGFAGDRLAKPSRIPFLKSRDTEGDDAKPTFGRRWVDRILEHKLATFALGLAVAVVVSIPAGSLRLALPDDGTAKEGSGPRVAYDLIAENFGPGLNGPLLVVVDTAGADDPAAAVAAANEAVASMKDDVAAIIPAGPVDPTDAAAVEAFDQQLAATNLATLTVVPKTGPSEAATQDLVDALRERVSSLQSETGAQALVTGQTAVGVDVSESLADAFPHYLGVIVGLALILLVVVFRSIFVPIKAVVGFLFSIMMALGATVAVFQWGWFGALLGLDQGSPVMSMLPILMTGILFGLAMDYEFFLVTRMREEHAHGAPASDAIAVGFGHGARVVTAAALIMLSVFGSFALATDPIIKSIGFALAFGIVADAFLIRMTLVPAIMGLVGERAWWLPKWLDRVLPDLDIEGEKLTHLLDEGATRPGSRS